MGELVRAVLMVAALGGSAQSFGVAPGLHTRLIAGEPAVATLQSSDPWLGSDKFRHAWMSYGATVFTFAVIAAGDGESRGALRLSMGVAGVAGVAKEVHDQRAGGSFSARDLIADAVGILAAYMILREVR